MARNSFGNIIGLTKPREPRSKEEQSQQQVASLLTPGMPLSAIA